MKTEESHIWWLLLGIAIGFSSVYLSEGNYRMLVLNLGAFGMILIVWRIILWCILNISFIKKYCIKEEQ